MNSKLLELLNKLDAMIPNHCDIQCLFRGQIRDWPIKPKAGRDEFSITDEHGRPVDDHGIFFDNFIPRSKRFGLDTKNEWDLYAIAQHHGLATRLVDWSTNPLVAIFFACNSEIDVDGVLHVWRPVRVPVINTDCKIR
jgi:hypothetical protein